MPTAGTLPALSFVDPSFNGEDQGTSGDEHPHGDVRVGQAFVADVVHAFWVPEFLFKRDVIPDHPNHFEITATQTGTYIGHCSELCGLYHSRMLFTLKVVTPQQYQAYIAAQQALQKSGSAS